MPVKHGKNKKKSDDSASLRNTNQILKSEDEETEEHEITDRNHSKWTKKID